MKLFICFFIFVIPAFIQKSSANPDFELRRNQYIATTLAAPTGDKLILQAYEGLPLDTTTLNNILDRLFTKTTSDFDIVKLIRVLFFTNGNYDSQILPVLYSVPYWLTKSDTTRNYWSENHMIMWMSSDWLLHERYGKMIDANLDSRLRHYLKLKNQFGFYEFFSPVYAPYSLSGLLNLADFAQDAEIKLLATQAAERLLKELLMLTNDVGVCFPTAGRAYPGQYNTPYNLNHNNLIYLLTGLGDAPQTVSHAGGFLATTALPVDDIIASRTIQLDTLYQIGHSLDSGFVINDSLTDLDRIIFQWSSGGYFHPAVAGETALLLVDSNLLNHVDFTLLRPLSILSPQGFPAIAQSLSSISKSTVISGQDIAIFKDHSVTLSSAQDFWKGKVGFQQHPIMAAVGTTAVYLGSGEPKTNWLNRNSNNANTHLPYIAQKKNIALVMYRPEITEDWLGQSFNRKEVALHWKENDFDEVVTDSLWLFGRQNNSYVAVRRSCSGEINGVRACPTNGGQTWILAVGNNLMYGSFEDFQNTFSQAHYEEEWFTDSVTTNLVYYAKITVDSLTLEYAWNADHFFNAENRPALIEKTPLKLFPNPADEFLTMQWNDSGKQTLVEIYNLSGQRVFQSVTDRNEMQVPVKNFKEGIYAIRISDDFGNSEFKRMMVVH